MTKYFYETDGGETGYIEAESIDGAREIFREEHPDIRPECAGIWAPEDPEYPGTHENLTKDWAVDVLVERIEKKFPGVDVAKERAALEEKSRAVLLHSVGAQLYGDINNTDESLMAYAYGEMTESEQRVIDKAG